MMGDSPGSLKASRKCLNDSTNSMPLTVNLLKKEGEGEKREDVEERREEREEREERREKG